MRSMIRTPSRGGEEVRRSTPPTSPLLLRIEYTSCSTTSCPWWKADGGWGIGCLLHHKEERGSSMLHPPPPLWLWGGEEEYAAYSIVCLLSSSQWSILVLNLALMLHWTRSSCVHIIHRMRSSCVWWCSSARRRRGGVLLLHTYILGLMW